MIWDHIERLRIAVIAVSKMSLAKGLPRVNADVRVRNADSIRTPMNELYRARQASAFERIANQSKIAMYSVEASVRQRKPKLCRRIPFPTGRNLALSRFT